MNEDAFARRFYADRAELESLRIRSRSSGRPTASPSRRTTRCARRTSICRAIEFTDQELAALQTALHLLDGEFAYAEPLRLALQQITWGRPSPLRAPEQRRSRSASPPRPAATSSRARLAKIETAIFRNKTITFDYYTMERDEVGARKVDPYHLLFQGGQFYLLGYAHEREAIRVFRLSRIQRQGLLRHQGRARLQAPGRLRPARLRQPGRVAVRRGAGRRRDPALRAHRLADRAPLRPLRGDAVADDDGRSRASGCSLTAYSNPRADHRLGARPRRACAAARAAGAGGGDCSAGSARAPRVTQSCRDLAPTAARRRYACRPALGRPRRSASRAAAASARAGPDAAIRPERFARLVTLAEHPDPRRPRRRARARVAEVCERLQTQRRSCARTSAC